VLVKLLLSVKGTLPIVSGNLNTGLLRKKDNLKKNVSLIFETRNNYACQPSVSTSNFK
jgi:hypothetical protein